MLRRGTQIVYIPNHAQGDIEHNDVEYGFVEEPGETVARCRYWRQGSKGTLRTIANGEVTPVANLRAHDSIDQVIVDKWLKWIDTDGRGTISQVRTKGKVQVGENSERRSTQDETNGDQSVPVTDLQMPIL